MKKRWMIRLFSVAVALMLPLGAMAQGAAMDLLKQAKDSGKEIVTTVSFVPGTEMTKEQAVADLFGAFALKIQSLKDDYGSIAVALNGTDMTTVQFRSAEDGFYVMSKELGDQALYFSFADIQKAVTDLMKNNGSDAANASQVSSAIENAITQFTAEKKAMELSGDTTLTKEQKKQKILEAIGADDTFIAWVNGIEAKQVITKGSFTLGDSDTADTKTEMTLTAEDLTTLFDTKYVKDKMIAQMTASKSDTTAQDVDKALAEVKDAVTKSGITIPITVYTNGEDQFVAMEYGMTGTFENKDVNLSSIKGDTQLATPNEPVKVDIAAQVITKSVDGGKNYTVALTAKKDDAAAVTLNANLLKQNGKYTGAMTLLGREAKPVLNLALTADTTDPKNIQGELSGTATDIDTQKTYAFTVNAAQAVGDTTVDTTLSLSTGDTLDAIKADPTKALQGTLKLNTVVQDDSGAFKDISAATPDTSLQVIQMSDAQLGEYVKKLESNYMQLLVTVYSSLPQSVAQSIGSMTSN